MLHLSVASPYRVAPDRSLDAAQDATSGQVRSLSGLSFFWLADATTNALVQLGTRFDARLRKQIPTLVDGVVLLRFFAIEHSALGRLLRRAAERLLHEEEQQRARDVRGLVPRRQGLQVLQEAGQGRRGRGRGRRSGRRRRRVRGRQRLGEAPGEEGQDPRLRLGREVPEEALQEEEQGRHEGVEGVRVRLRVSPRLPSYSSPPIRNPTPRQDHLPRSTPHHTSSHYKTTTKIETNPRQKAVTPRPRCELRKSLTNDNKLKLGSR